MFLALPVAAPASEPVKQAGKQEEAKQICKGTRVVGSRIKKRVCMTEAQWESLSQQAQETNDKIKGTPILGTPPG